MPLTFTVPAPYEAQPIIPAGVYDATLKSVEERESTQPSQYDNGSTSYLFWTFAIVGKKKTVEVSGSSSPRFGPKAKANRWVSALLGRKLATGEVIDLEALIGKPCKLTVTLETDDQNFERNRIGDVLPMGTGEEPF